MESSPENTQSKRIARQIADQIIAKQEAKTEEIVDQILTYKDEKLPAFPIVGDLDGDDDKEQANLDAILNILEEAKKDYGIERAVIIDKIREKGRENFAKLLEK